MTRLTLILAAISGIAFAADLPFTGTWTNGAADEVIEIKGGAFQCVSCGVPNAVPMDGKDHASVGTNGAGPTTTRSYAALSDRVVEGLNKDKDGRTVRRTLRTVSPDGNRMELIAVSYPAAGGQPSSMVAFQASNRVGKAAPGANLVAGTWRPIPETIWSSLGNKFEYTQSATGLKYSGGGTAYDAKFDGKDYPVAGGGKGAAVVVRRIDDRTIDEVWKQDGKERMRGHMVISADGKTLTQTNFRDGKQQGTPQISARTTGK